MSTLVLLDRNGQVARKLQFVTLPPDYVIPEGMMASWKTEFYASSTDVLDDFRSPREPLEAYFYLGNAQGLVSRHDLDFKEAKTRLGSDWLKPSYNRRILTVTVQGTVAKDVMTLRDRILTLIQSHASWSVSNDLNPKPEPNQDHPKPEKVGWFMRLLNSMIP